MLETVNVVWSEYGQVWSFMAQLGVLLIALLFANTLRIRVPFLRRMLFPSALIAGLLIFALKSILSLCRVDAGSLFDNATMQIITYHTLGLGFAAVTLKRATQKKDKKQTVKIFDYALINSGTYMLQAVLGLLVTLIFFGGIYYSGMLLPLGFAQGPGNAMIWGGNYSEHGLTGGASFGLAIATVGFIMASVVGVIYMNIMRKKGKLQVRDTGKKEIDDPVYNGTAPESVSVDKLSINIALIALVYVLCYGLMWGLSALGINLITNLVWGLNFLWAMLFATIVKAVLNKMEDKSPNIPTYRSNYLLDRVSSFLFDLMIVAGVASIEWESIATYWLPLVVLAAVGTVASVIYIYFAAKCACPGYENETFLVQFGTLTGTVSNGMILLREIDPDFSTPAANNEVMSNVFNLPMLAPMFLLLSAVPGGLFGVEGKAGTWICVGIFAVLLGVYSLLLFRRQIFKKHYKKEDQEVWTDNGYVARKDMEQK